MTNVLQAVYIATAAMLLLALVRFVMSRRATGEERAILTEKARRYFILAGVMGLASAGGYTATTPRDGSTTTSASTATANDTVAPPAATPSGAPAAPAPSGWTLVPGGGAVGVGPDATHERLRTRLGDSLVILETVETPAGRVEATILFPHDPMRRLEVHWRDIERRERPAMLRVRGTASVWRLASGVTLGSIGEDGTPVRELSVPVGN